MFCVRLLVVICLSIMFVATALPCSAQTSSQPDLQQILTSAAERRQSYIQEFSNLLAQETKSFEIFDKKGVIKKRRSVVSTFIVYPLSKKEGRVAEFRNVISVDGRSVDDSDKRAQEFFDDVAKAESSAKEVEKIEREGSRFDEEISINGLTLYQVPVLAENLQPIFDFSFEGKEMINGRETYIVSYRQIKDSPYIAVNPKRIDADGKLTLIYALDLDDIRNTVVRLNGRFWVDTATFRILREDRSLNIQHSSTSTPLTAIRTLLEYQVSSFDIFTPKRLAFTQFALGKKDEQPRKELNVFFEYSNFTKPDVEVKSADIKN